MKETKSPCEFLDLEQRRAAIYGAALDDILDAIESPDALAEIRTIVEEALRDG